MVFKTQSYVVQTSILLLASVLFPIASLADGKNLSLTEDKQIQDKQLVDKQIADENEQSISEQTLEYNFSPEDRARLRKALADYSKSTDPEHHQIELRRKAMKESVEERFNGCDKDNDESIDREEATLCLPQIARRFSTVDVDEDGVITLEELELAQAKSIERQKAAEAKIEAQKIQEAEAEIKNKGKFKGSKQALNAHKKPAQSSVNLTTEQ
jgi:Ca2+-binding EF-hand superfamily protein